MTLSAILSRLFRWGTPVLLAVLGVLLILVISRRMEWGAYDLYARWSAKQEARQSDFNSPVTLVLIDDASIDRLKGRYGLPPWPRSAYLDIFRKLQAYSPAVTVFDGHFMYFARNQDKETFDALRGIPHLVLGLVYQPDYQPDYQLDDPAEPRAGDNMPDHMGAPQNHGASQWLNQSALNYYQLNLGVVNVNPNPDDGILRAIQPIWLPSEKSPGVFPSLALAAALEYKRTVEPSAAWVLNWDSSGANGASPRQLMFLSERAPAKSEQFSLQKDGSLLLSWRPKKALTGGVDISHSAISLWEALSPQAGQTRRVQKLLSGRIALLGSVSSLSQDIHHTPLSIHHAGVDIQAGAIDNFLSGAGAGLLPTQAAPSLFLPLASVVFFLAAFLIRLKVSRVERGLLYTLGTMVIYAWFAFWSFYRLHQWLPLVTPELFMLLGFLVATAWLTLVRGKEVVLLEGHLSRLVSRSVFSEIRKMSKIITQGGQKLEITAMMVDIRNFTSLAENLPPQEVSALLNEFYEVVVGVVFAYRGTVDKFLGDGVMILFGAPINDERHAWDALRASLALVAKTEALCAQWRQTRGIDTRIGVSLHSGIAFVGFIGPKSKLEYTAIGDTVNLCARLQNESKRLATPLIVSGDTVTCCLSIVRSESDENPKANIVEDDWIERYLKAQGPVLVRGRETPIDIWTLNPVWFS